MKGTSIALAMPIAGGIEPDPHGAPFAINPEAALDASERSIASRSLNLAICVLLIFSLSWNDMSNCGGRADDRMG